MFVLFSMQIEMHWHGIALQDKNLKLGKVIAIFSGCPIFTHSFSNPVLIFFAVCFLGEKKKNSSKNVYQRVSRSSSHIEERKNLCLSCFLLL